MLRLEQDSQISLDFDFQRISSSSIRSSRKTLREDSKEKELELGGGGGLLNKIKLSKSRLDSSLNFPKMKIIPPL
jgi:hypothetical protein